MGKEKSRSQRLIISTETKINCIEHELEHELATKILFTMLDNYVEKGVIYLGKELKFRLRCDRPRKYVINLYNDVSKKDTVLIRLDEDDTARIVKSCCDSDSECPTLI